MNELTKQELRIQKVIEVMDFEFDDWDLYLYAFGERIEVPYITILEEEYGLILNKEENIWQYENGNEYEYEYGVILLIDEYITENAVEYAEELIEEINWEEVDETLA